MQLHIETSKQMTRTENPITFFQQTELLTPNCHNHANKPLIVSNSFNKTSNQFLYRIQQTEKEKRGGGENSVTEDYRRYQKKGGIFQDSRWKFLTEFQLINFLPIS